MAEFRFALRQTAPVLCGYLFLGLAFGLLLQQAGYGWPWALLISGIVYAGSMQFVLVGLLGGGFASLASVALTTLSVNSRHLFYGLSFLDTFRQMGRAKPYMIFSLSDETYSLQCSVQIPEQLNANRVRLWISALDQGYWVAGSVTGAALGSVLPFDLTGIDFAMTALFVVIFVDQWRAAKSHLPAVAGLVFGRWSAPCWRWPPAAAGWTPRRRRRRKPPTPIPPAERRCAADRSILQRGVSLGPGHRAGGLRLHRADAGAALCAVWPQRQPRPGCCPRR